MSKTLIVTADDFGIDPARNRGIADAFKDGVVTSVSFLANGGAFENAVRIAKRSPMMGLGLHLNLSEGAPVADDVKSLVGPDGYFLGKEGARRAATEGKFDPAEIARETAAQIERLMEFGIRPVHLDGHQHIHIYSGVTEPAVKTALEYDIRWVRSPLESVKPDWASPEQIPLFQQYHDLAEKARKVTVETGARVTDHFNGIHWTGHMTEVMILERTESLPDGITEWMTHPGFEQLHSVPFSNPERETELEILTSPRVRERLQEHKVQLKHFGEL